MQHASIKSFIQAQASAPLKGPIAIVLVEDAVEIESTLRHHLGLGFRSVIALMPPVFDLPSDLTARIHRIHYNMSRQKAAETAINTLMPALRNEWVFYCYNAEYLFYPFCETRNVIEMLAFHEEERRDAMLCYVVDLYADDLHRFPNAVSLDQATMDRSGYYALARRDEKRGGDPKERQLDFFGGLRWRFEEHVPKNRRKIDRIALFRARKGLQLRWDHTFDDEEYNTYACPWHHNITAAICSFRTAKALKTNPGSTFDIESFNWHNSTPFSWDSKQLLDLGLIEPGQWF
ncbi:MAG: hypothetical protein AAF755_04290 [Pseudomonadota bacterium]